MENYYIVFQCPKCRQSMTIDSMEAFICKEHGTFARAEIRTSIQITNQKGKTQLQKAGATIYRLMPDLSFAEDIVIQKSERAPKLGSEPEKVKSAKNRRVILVTKDKEQLEIFRGPDFSEEEFQQEMNQQGHTSVLETLY